MSAISTMNLEKIESIESLLKTRVRRRITKSKSRLGNSLLSEHNQQHLKPRLRR
jgi:hypothetical protein